MLSARGTAASLRRQEHLWDIMANPYCSELNLKGFINLGTAENCLMQIELIEHIKNNFNPPRTALSYGEGPSGSMRLRATLAAFFNKFFLPSSPVLASHISISNGVTGSLERCAFELGDPDDGFLLGRPYYGAFPFEIGNRAKIRTIPVSFERTDPLGLGAVSIYESSIIEAHARSQRVRGLLLCSPHNPLGRCYTEEVLVALMRLCQKYRIHMIVDEVYALSIFDNPYKTQTTQFTSVLSINPTGIIDPALLHVLWGTSKDFGCNGLRIGCVVSQNSPSLISALDAHAPYSYPAAFLEYVACIILEDHKFIAGFINENRKRIAENYVVVTTFLENHNIPFHKSTNAGLFVWANLGVAWLRRQYKESYQSHEPSKIGAQSAINFRKVRKDSYINLDIHRRLIEEKVYLIDGEEFGSEVAGYFRIVFTQPKHVLETGLDRMAKALDL